MKNKKETKTRITAVVDDEDYERIKYWADKKDMSVNEFVRYSVDLAIKRENKDYDLPSLEAARLNQLIEAMSVLSLNVSNLEHIVTDGFNTFVTMARGENYLLDDGDDNL